MNKCATIRMHPRPILFANRMLVEMFEKKIQDKLAEIWGEENGGKDV